VSNALLALHGFTQNGSGFRAALDGLAGRLPRDVELVCLDAPHSCSEGAVERLRSARGLEAPPPPWLSWWDATDDGTVYHGLEETLAVIRAALERHPNAGILGFSQGAILGAAIAALAERGDLPAIAYAILVAGRVPRATALTPAFTTLIDVPSLHVWGTEDSFAVAEAPVLVERFAPAVRQTVVWKGPHTVPTRGPAADRIVEFVEASGAPKK
jgi:pimeloyl-ACP methyl ester carboxylesterase